MVDWERMVNGWKGDHYYSVRLNKVTDFLLLLFFFVVVDFLDSYRAFLPR